MTTYNFRCKRGKLERKESVSVRCDDLFILTTNDKFEYLRGELLTKNHVSRYKSLKVTRQQLMRRHNQLRVAWNLLVQMQCSTRKHIKF